MYRKAVSGEDEQAGVDFLFSKDSLTVFFENQEALTPEDTAVCRLVGAEYAGPQSWPQLRRFEPGFFPWLPDECDAVFLTVCLEQLTDVARRSKACPDILGPRDHKTFLARIPALVDGQTVWREKFISPEPLVRIIRITPKVDQALLAEVFGKAKKTGMIWEADCFFGHMPVGKPGQRPRYPFCYMIAHDVSGYVLLANLVDKNDYGAGFLGQMSEAVKKNGVYPETVHIRHAHLANVLAVLATFGIAVKVVKKLPMVDRARGEMFKGRASKQLPSQKQTARPGKNAVYQFKVTLDNIRPAIWRRIQLKADSSLTRLAATILIAMGWENSHLHQFHIAGRHIGLFTDDDGEFDDFEDERGFRLCDFSPEEIKRFVFEYDFGDGWEHSILLEKILEPQKGVKYPACLAGKHSCPPEDCGGARGYMDFLHAISDLKHPEHERMMEWSAEILIPSSLTLMKSMPS